MIDRRIRPMLRLGLLGTAVFVTSLMAMSGTALAEHPVAGHWEGTNGVSFWVNWDGHVFDIRWGYHNLGHSDTRKQDEFERCQTSGSQGTSHEDTYCIFGQFSSRHHASGIVTRLPAPITREDEWTASPDPRFRTLPGPQ
jgi:hypothetical protein